MQLHIMTEDCLEALELLQSLVDCLMTAPNTTSHDFPFLVLVVHHTRGGFDM